MESTIWILTALFFILLFIVAGKKGFRLLISLAITVLALIFIATPLIAHGFDPEYAVLLLAVPIVAIIVYITEGFGVLSHLSIIAIVLNFLCISFLTFLSVHAAHLTGLVSSDESFLGLTGINLPELLIAGITLGTLGILTEMVVTQIATVMELMRANPTLPAVQLYAQAYTVGTAHLGSIVNTLFLVYAGVSFPLLIIYAGGGGTLHGALNYEPIVSEIIRTLVGIIGLIIAMPVSTRMSVWWLKDRFEKK